MYSRDELVTVSNIVIYVGRSYIFASFTLFFKVYVGNLIMSRLVIYRRGKYPMIALFISIIFIIIITASNIYHN
jgi:hypothetical protein